jgi:hypothetical protein
MIARREADAGSPEARTQGALETALGSDLSLTPTPFLIWVRLRTQHRGAQRRIATWLLIALGALKQVLARRPAAARAEVPDDLDQEPGSKRDPERQRESPVRVVLEGLPAEVPE